MECFREKLNKALKKAEIQVDEEKLCKLTAYYEMLKEKNKVMNLTAITDEDEFIYKHFIDSLSIIKHTAIGEAVEGGLKCSVIDVGTGAGFPGMVLKIVYPKLQMILFDSLNKRLLFLNDIIDKLKLEGVTTLHGRAEDLGHNNEYREKADLVLARAVANLSTLSEYCIPLVKNNGIFVAYKSAELNEELAAAEKAIGILGGELIEKTEFILPGTDFSRSFAVIRKVRKTPARYPRKAGTPSREPI